MKKEESGMDKSEMAKSETVNVAPSNAEMQALVEKMWDEFYDRIEMQEIVRELIKAIDKNPKELRAALADYIQAEKESLFENGLCPSCGAALDFNADTNLDTKVPFGNQCVVYERGGRFECPSCGWREKL